jgi:signal transduction histidine kinase
MLGPMTSRKVWGTMSKKPARHGRDRPQRTSVFAVSGWPLRRKVALALAIPLILAVTLGALRVNSDLSEAENSSASAKQVTVLGPAVDYVTAAERAMVAAYETASTGSQAELTAALEDLKAAARDLESTRNSADLTPEQNYQVDVLLDLTEQMRGPEASTLSPGVWTAQMTVLQSAVTQLIATIAGAQLEPQPRLEQLTQALAGRFSLSMQQSLVATELAGETGSLQLFAELGAEATAIDRLASALGDTEPTIADLRTANFDRSATVRLGGNELGSGDLGGDDAYSDYDSLISGFLDDIDQALDESASSARTSALVNAAVTLGALLAAILLALLVSRLLLRPIRRVREGALDVANEQLPEEVARIRAGGDPGPIEPIDVTTHEEIGQMARAVDDLHEQAVLLASREANLRSQVSDMFVTLSRRHNSLINQQLDLIESLETDEEDDRRLASLFRLDHLAARMRRTSESLLVLADAPPTRATATDKLSVTAALQAATAAVQDYQRVRVESAADALITDSAAADVVHLLTELVDNALAYSSPSTTVSLQSSPTPEGVAIEIADEGLGISAESLAELNDILHAGGEVTPDTARRMGLFVVSRLAQRNGISVSLQRNYQRGITARVVIPDAALERGQPDDGRQRPAEVPSVNHALPEQRHPSTAPDLLGLGTGSDAPSDLPSRTPAAGAPPRTPGPATPVPTAGQAATPDLPWSGDGESDTPIFLAMRSAWLSTAGDAPWLSTEVEEGWDRADQVAESLVDTPVNASGLPVRRPGNRLVPGGVTTSTISTARDPEAIRARLAAHAEGVSRGRRRSATATSDQSPTEAGPS